MFTLRKIGGLHWIKLGRIRIAWCVVKPKPVMLPTAAQLREYGFPGT